MSFSGREFDGLSEEEQREACRTARYDQLLQFVFKLCPNDDHVYNFLLADVYAYM